MSNKNISETLCEAVDIIAQARAKQVSSDQTILCTITNDTLKDKGQYKVSNGSTEFYAYTQITDYKNNDNVYVQIPMGDWNAQKFIIGKKTNQDTSEFFTYKNPFNNLVDITGNIINSNVPTGESALVANNPEETSIILWTYNIPKEVTSALRMEQGPNHSGYTRLGLQASFQAALNPFNYKEYEYDASGNIALDENKLKIIKSQATSNVIDGEYGLRLHLKVTRSQTLTQNKDAGQEKTQDVILELNTQNMNGNPYNFNSFFQQEVVYHIEEYESIEQISIEFYQKDGSFVDAYEHALPHKDDFGRSIVPNLYVKDIYLCLGYDVSEFDDEMIKIYTLDTTTYSRKIEPFTDNAKKIQLRWIHKMPDGSFKSIDRDDIDDYNFKIQWYRYSLGSPSSDIYSGKEYQHLSYEEWDNGKCYREIEDENWINNNLKYEKKLYPGFFYTYLLPDVALSTEIVKAVLLFNGKPIRSNIITLTNENEVVSRYTVDALEALVINCNNGLDEAGNPIYSNNYLIYNQGNELIDESQAKKPRKFELTFNPEVPTDIDETEGLKFARYVEWRIPRKNTMITLPSGYNDHDAIIDDNNPEYYLIRRNGVYNDQDKNYRVYAKQSFMIDGYYSAEKSNNTVQCTIEKEPNTFYISTVDLLFGVAGTTGTDATLVLSFEDTSLAAINASSSGSTNIIARLYDAKNEDVTEVALQKDCQFIWKWKGAEDFTHSKLTITKGNEELPRNYCSIQNDGEKTLTRNEWNILECTVNGWGDYPLIAYFAIPFCQNPIGTEHRTLYMEGASKIIYNADGTPSYYKNPYKLYYAIDENDIDQNGNPIVNSVINNYFENNDKLPNYGVYWEISPNSNYWKDVSLTGNKISTYERYIPKIILEENISTGYRENKGIQPLGIYVKGADDYITLNCIDTTGRILWSQPLLILQNRYPSSMINDWDGQLEIDEAENAIMAAKIAAGTKDDMNRFSGVMLGDWNYRPEGSGTSVEKSLKETGLYGFHEGAMSFAFKENGHAFIGKDGSGRIIFDGKSGSITSANWKNNELGMNIEIDDGWIQMRSKVTDNNTNENFNSYIDLNASAQTYPLSIGKSKYEFERNFRVEWDGSAHLTNGEFSGTIYAESGELGDLTVTGTLSGGQINGSEITGSTIDGNTITGGTISGSELNVKKGFIGKWMIDDYGLINNDNSSYISGGVLVTPAGGMLLAGRFQLGGAFDEKTKTWPKLPGYLGYLSSDMYTDSTEENDGIGFYYKDTNNETKQKYVSQVKATAGNAGIRYGVNSYFSASLDQISLGSRGDSGNVNMEFGKSMFIKQSKDSVAVFEAYYKYQPSGDSFPYNYLTLGNGYGDEDRIVIGNNKKGKILIGGEDFYSNDTEKKTISIGCANGCKVTIKEFLTVPNLTVTEALNATDVIAEGDLSAKNITVSETLSAKNITATESLNTKNIIVTGTTTGIYATLA